MLKVNDNMERKDKIFFAIYAGVKDIDRADIPEFLHQIAQAVKTPDDTSVEFFVIPKPSSNDTVIECLNPVPVSEKAYKAIEERVAKYNAALDNFLKKLQESQKDMPENIQKVVDDHFWDML